MQETPEKTSERAGKMTGKRSIHLVGGVPFEADEVFELAGRHFASLAPRLPDGEKKRGWLRPQAPIVARAPGMIPGQVDRFLDRVIQRYRPAPGQEVGAIRFGPLGYLDAATQSYAIFAAARAAGKIPATTRFQISVPTAFAVMGHCIDGDVARAVWPVYEAQLIAEIEEIAKAIPHRDLAVQWDVAVEITQVLDNPRGKATGYSEDELAAAIARALDGLPRDVEGGLHLCYGDAGEDKHLIDPKDMRVMVSLYNAVAGRARHDIAWLHMPVPKDRDDDGYFAPLRDLRLRAETELFLGLVHRLDGIAGAARRVAAARKFSPCFGVATECGLGRYIAPEAIAGLFALHREVAELA